MVDPKTNIYGYNGQQKSKGIEFTLFGEPVKGLHVLGGISNMLVKNIGEPMMENGTMERRAGWVRLRCSMI